MFRRVIARIWEDQLWSPMTTTSSAPMVQPPPSGTASGVRAPPSFGVQTSVRRRSSVKENVRKPEAPTPRSVPSG